MERLESVEVEVKRLFSCLALVLAAASMSGAAVGQVTGYVQINPPINPQAGGFSTQTGTVGSLTDTGLASNQCVQTGAGGLLTTTGAQCGSGSGGGASALGVNNFGVPITTPTAQINFIGPISVTAIGSTATVTVSQISLSTGVTGSLPASKIAAGTLGASVVASSLAVNSVYPAAVSAATYPNIILPAPNIASGYLGSMVIISSAAPASIGVPQLNFTGTPSSSTIARGDGVWAAPSSLGLGTITGVTAGSGLTGGGTSGNVTVSVSSISLTSQVSGILPIANGGNGTATPGILQGSNIIITGAWPNQIINSVASGGSSGNGALVNTASQFSVPFYSASGSSNTLSGSANFTYNQTTVTVLGAVVSSTFTASEYCFANGTCQNTAGGGAGGYAVQPATVTFNLNLGVTASTMTVSTMTVSTQTVTGEIILKDGTIITSTSTFGGSSTSPGGSTSQVQYNLSGSFAGSPGFTTDGSSVTVSTAIVNNDFVSNGNATIENGSSLTMDYPNFPVGTNSQIKWKEFGSLNGSIGFNDTLPSGFKTFDGSGNVVYQSVTSDASGVTKKGLGVKAGGELRFYDSVNNGTTHFTSFQASGTVASNLEYTLPSVGGREGQVFTLHADSSTFWSTPSAGGGSGLTFSSFTATNPVLYDGAGTFSLSQVSLSTSVTGSLPASKIAAGALGAGVIASSLTATGVTAGSYTNTNLTVNAEGQITIASNGSGGGTSISSGSIVQVVSSNTVTVSTTSNTSFTNTFLGASITPKSVADIIVIHVLGSLNNSTANAIATISRGSTNLLGSAGGCSTISSANTPCSMVWVDQGPLTSGATTYNVQLAASVGTSTSTWGLANQTQVLVLEEINPNGPAASSAASALGVNYNGVAITTPTAQINFVGPGVFVAASGSTATVTISSWPAGVPSINSAGNSAITSSTTFSGGSNVTLSQLGNTISIASSGGIGSSSGTIVQVLQFSTTTISNTNSTTFSTTSLSGTITPISASDYIKITAVGTIANAAIGTMTFSTISKGFTNILSSNGQCVKDTSSNADFSCTMVFIDTGPLITSATSYFVEIKTSNASNAAQWGSTNILQNMILEEFNPAGGVTGIVNSNSSGSPLNAYYPANGTTISPDKNMQVWASSETHTGSGGLGITYGVIAGSVTASNLTSGQCVQTGTGGLLTGTGSACGAGGGGSGGYAVQPATVTFNLAVGLIVSTIQANAFNATVTSVTVTGSGGFTIASSSAGQIALTEGSSSTVVGTGSGVDSLWADSGSHTLEFNPNNTSTYTVAGTSVTVTPGHILIAGTAMGSYLDGGAIIAGVTSVTGTPPINSSGGTTPAISLSQTIGQSETITGSSFTVAGIQGLVVTGATTGPLVTISSVPTGVALVSVSSTPASVATDFVLTVSSQNGTTTFAAKYDGDLISSGTTPGMGTCGSSPSVFGTDTAGVITVGAGIVTSCTMNWANTKGSIPVCVMSTNSTAVTGDITTTSTSSVTFGFSATLGGGTINYLCFGNKG